MQLPQGLLSALEGVKGFDKKAFIDVHNTGAQVTSIRINPAKVEAAEAQHFSSLPIEQPVPWTQYGYYLHKRPSFTFDPLFHAGCYYVQEASSMFLEQAVRQTVDLSRSLNVLDLCAAPGGKSTHIQSLISAESLLVSNEVIKSRAGILKQNIIKWGCANVVVTNNDPQHFARLESFFDLMVVDAPCSGSGLFRRDEEAINEWSEDNVLLCCGRQKRIIADALPALKEGGVLIYSTCSYSREEDEDIADWLNREMGLENIRLSVEESWNIVESASGQTNSFGYRFFPDKVKGEGFFLACFRRVTSGSEPKLKAAKLEKGSAREKALAAPWLAKKVEVLKHNYLYALPLPLVERYSIIRHYLNIQYAGVPLGEIMKEKLVPEHALALSTLLVPSIPATDLDYDTAIRYLQKQDVTIKTAVKGWQLVSYQRHNLGWINALQNRVNNYYPKELRILKQKDDTPFEK